MATRPCKILRSVLLGFAATSLVVGCGDSTLPTHLGERDAGPASDVVEARPDAVESGGDDGVETDAAPFAGCASDGSLAETSADATNDTGDASCAIPTIVDPDFRTATAWTTTGGAVLTCGAAVLGGAAQCNFGGIGETISPAIGCGRPLVMNVATSLPQNDHDIDSIGIRVGTGWTFFDLPNPPRTTSVCLGASVFENPAAVFLAAGNQPGMCPAAPDQATTIEINHVSIDADTMNACPAIGTIPDGDFEGDSASWQLDTRQDVTSEIANGFGDGGSTAAHITTNNNCYGGSMAGSISIPTAAMVPNPALRIWSKGTTGATALVSLGFLERAETAQLVGQGAGVVKNWCLPRWAQGTVQPIAFGFALPGGLCGQEDVQDFAFDDLAFVSDASCPTNANIFDGGFEQMAPGSTTAPFWSPSSTTTPRPNGAVEIKVDPTFAHTGNVAALLSVSAVCEDAQISGSVTVPGAAQTAGPMLKFWYKTSALSRTSPDVTMTALAKPLSLVASPTWRQVTACLDPRLAGWPDHLLFDTGTSGGCDVSFPAETLAVDDVELTNDPSCPAR